MKTLKINFLVLLMSIVFFSSCTKENLCIEGTGSIVTKTLSIPSFDAVEFQEAGNVIITQGPIQEVKVTGNANIIDRIEDEVFNGLWVIDLGRSCFEYDELTIEITMPDIKELTLSGSGEIVLNDFQNQSDLYLKLSGSGIIETNDCSGTEFLDVFISGSGTIEGKGGMEDLEELEIDITGSGDFEGYQLDTDTCDIKISGAGNCFVSVQNSLDVKITGSGSVYYHGNPTVNETVTGSGTIVKTN